MLTMTFMREVVLSNKTTGALAPSSKELAEIVTDMAGLQGAGVIVEYGPGTGVFTEVIQRKKEWDAFFVSLEVNEEFVEATRKRCPHVRVVQDSAENTGKYLKEAGHDYCDIIISGLPWTRFDDAQQDRILDATYDVLRPGGRFVTFGYSFSMAFRSGRKFFRHKLPAKFDRVIRSKPTWKNFPPTVVYTAEKD